MGMNKEFNDSTV